MKNNKIVTYKLNKNQYLSQIEPFKSKGIPSNIILFKELPGCGATRSEIEFSRHSIIVEPNVPVIKGKTKQFGKLVCGIYEGVKIEEIVTYLHNEIEHKKIIVTPESFWKVKEAIEESPLNMFTDFFLLFDECEKIIQDVSYRSDISLPMNDFFQFKCKAFVSATAIIPSDPRFAANNFKVHTIKPTFKYAQNLKLICTNNIIYSFQQCIKDNPNKKYFIFFNSTDTIDAVIKKMEIKGDTMIFCAEKSRKKLLGNHYKKTQVSTDITSFKKFNFFTSRFFSAVDINYELFQCDPTIILVTDIVSAEHSMLDPFTEVVQIQGRFRETKTNPIKRNIVHITNTNPHFTSLSKLAVLEYLDECHTIYKAVHRFYSFATTPSAKDVLTQVLERIDYARYLKKDTMERNFDMIDNLIFEEGVKGIYKNTDGLKSAYNMCSHFLVNLSEETYSFTDTDRKKAEDKTTRLKSLYTIIGDGLKQLHDRQRNGEVSDFEYANEMANFQIDFPEQMAVVNKYGIDNSYEADFNIYKIKGLLLAKQKGVDHFSMMTFLREHLKEGEVYTSSKLTSIIGKGLTNNKIGLQNPTLQYLRKNFAEISDPKDRVYMGKAPNGNDIKGYKILRFLDKGLE
ncbi:hypothetical protein [Pedobacter sp. N23S346]|uniref:hypothetical protein n=1 Tax=Pedobacter sp. N23S346 TaxID=3402750 RepID=UPI003ACECEDD